MADAVRVEGVEPDAEAEKSHGDGDAVCGPEVVGVVGVDVDLAFVGYV